mmetsp:Transcript_12939/g.54288  ORF Transcript_12939/g.54288 Transcript_12939/m.54288 type:complete len:206 (-) Transcript_12939:1260-1877(-)
MREKKNEPRRIFRSEYVRRTVAASSQSPSRPVHGWSSPLLSWHATPLRTPPRARVSSRQRRFPLTVWPRSARSYPAPPRKPSSSSINQSIIQTHHQSSSSSSLPKASSAMPTLGKSPGPPDPPPSDALDAVFPICMCLNFSSTLIATPPTSSVSFSPARPSRHAFAASRSFARASFPVANANAFPASSSCNARLICATMNESRSV